MLNFDYYAPTRLIFGKGAQKDVGKVLKAYGAKKVLLHYGGGSIKASGLYGDVTAQLKSEGLAVVELGGVAPNPRLALVREGIALCRKEGVDFILSVGGGSVIDSGKAIAAGALYDGDVWELYDTGKPIEKAIPNATVLTIPAAGSESSPHSVITNEEAQLKKGYDGGGALRPRVSFVNPELFFTLPKNQIANGVADMMSHIFERYFTNSLHTDVTDGMCEAVLRAIIKNAPKLMENPRDYDAWCEVGFGGTVAHIDILGLGRQQDWACHDMEHELSAFYDVAHGAGLAVLTPGWMRYVYKDNVSMFVQFAVKVMGVDGSFREPDDIALEGIARLSAFFQGLGQPASLAGLGIGEDKLETMAKRCTRIAFGEERPIGGLKKLHWQDVLNIYTLVK